MQMAVYVVGGSIAYIFAGSVFAAVVNHHRPIPDDDTIVPVFLLWPLLTVVFLFGILPYEAITKKLEQPKGPKAKVVK